MKTLATLIHILTAALLALIGLGAVGHRVLTYGWFDGLITPLIIGLLGLAALIVGVLSARTSRTGPARAGLLLAAPIFVSVAATFDYEPRGLVFGFVAAAPIFLASVMHARAARATPPPEDTSQ